MRIAQVAPLHEAVPPKFYGGTERVVSYLTEALVELGHEVTLFASGDSRTSAHLVSGCSRALRLEAIQDGFAPHMVLLEQVRRMAHEFDVLHFHLSYLPFSRFYDLGIPFVTTLHGRLDLPELQPVFNLFSRVPVIAISDAQRRPLPQANWLGTIYHGLPEQLLTPQLDRSPSYLAFLGRICAEKRADRAIEIAARAGLPLKIAAKVDPADRDYFRTVIEPLLSQPHVEFVGEISEAQKPAFLSGAKALLFPIDWAEPFGLVMIEAMACGTPVIAFNRGSVSEVVDEGVTGYIVDDVASAVEAVNRSSMLCRATIRARFLARFEARTMAQKYVAQYTALAGNACANLSEAS
ncbi:glycosyltransferase family 4 protein [Caballeronia sordidicola]|uniref:Glycosyltransferase n=1 Tax=Caballeronia sordidicola TaxID=196367 RepID=A0A226WVR0_CABSO|nr:glycosyltransferase family 4 protein [Caballeronia sordidicola]OXC74877.1 Glycosyltransferase [Caballeronia sordidicola]